MPADGGRGFAAVGFGGGTMTPFAFGGPLEDLNVAALAAAAAAMPVKGSLLLVEDDLPLGGLGRGGGAADAVSDDGRPSGGGPGLPGGGPGRAGASFSAPSLSWLSAHCSSPGSTVRKPTNSGHSLMLPSIKITPSRNAYRKKDWYAYV